jgi:hypothetical protein
VLALVTLAGSAACSSPTTLSNGTPVLRADMSTLATEAAAGHRTAARAALAHLESDVRAALAAGSISSSQAARIEAAARSVGADLATSTSPSSSTTSTPVRATTTTKPAPAKPKPAPPKPKPGPPGKHKHGGEGD